MNNFKRNSKSKIKRNLLGLFMVILLSIMAILYFSNKLTTISTSANSSPSFIKLSESENAHNTYDTSNGTTNTTSSTSNNKNSKNIILVNKWNPIPEAYDVDLVELSNGKSVDRSIYPALQEMFDNARANGIYPIVASGYRTAEDQQRLMDEKITAYISEGLLSSDAIKKANEWVATPNTSEHQLGIAVDINADGINSTGDEVYTWLYENAYRFGFICRYPADKVEITGVNYEPWHYRYVGIEVATEIHQKGICLEEYLENL